MNHVFQSYLPSAAGGAAWLGGYFDAFLFCLPDEFDRPRGADVCICTQPLVFSATSRSRAAIFSSPSGGPAVGVFTMVDYRQIEHFPISSASSINSRRPYGVAVITEPDDSRLHQRLHVKSGLFPLRPSVTHPIGKTWTISFLFCLVFTSEQSSRQNPAADVYSACSKLW